MPIGRTAADLRHWLTGPAATLWLEAGVDRRGGGYYDQLSHGDAANACDFKRLRVTCRQIFVFAKLDELGVAGARDAMAHGLEFLFSALAHPDGGFRRSVTLDRRPLDDNRDLYDLAFVIFALAAAFARLGDTALQDRALSVLSFIRERMTHLAGGFAEALPPVLPRRQNPHMHLLEACLAWNGRAGAFHDQAQELVDLLTARFWSGEHACIFEYFGEDLSPVAEPDRRIFEPGHHFEWIWLLDECRSAGLDVPDINEPLARRAVREGFAPGTGLPFAEVRADGTVQDTTCRIWMITEWLRVCATRDAALAGDWRTPLAHLWRFLDVPLAGLWREKCDAATYAFRAENVPASSLYHIVTGILPLIERPA